MPVTRELGKGKGLQQLLSGPLRGRVGNVEVHNATAVMDQNQENVKNLEANRGHGVSLFLNKVQDGSVSSSLCREPCRVVHEAGRTKRRDQSKQQRRHCGEH